MNTLIGILLVLAIFGKTDSQRYSKSFVDVLNSQRKRFKAESNIGVVPNLTWDDALEKIAKELPDDCNKWKHGSDYRIHPNLADDTSKVLHTTSNWLQILSAGYQDFQIPDAQKAVLKNMDNQYNENAEQWIMYGFEELNEKQTKVGCADTRCTGNVSPEVLKVLKMEKSDLQAKYEMQGVCVFGPTNTFNPQIRKEKYAEHTRSGPFSKDDGRLIHALALAEALLPPLPGGTPSPSKNGPEQSVPAQETSAQQQAPAPSPSPASTFATGWFSVVVLVLGFFL